MTTSVSDASSPLGSSPSPLLATTDLTKQFEANTAVEQVNLTVNVGDIYGLIGPNGAGKTTLLRMLATAEEPTVGDIYIQGQRLVPDQPNPDIQRMIGFLPDDFPLYDDLSVAEYLDYFARLYYLTDPDVGDRINEVLELVSLTNKRDSLISTLSRGMKQRLSLARTIIYRPKLLLLDEPVSGLDPIARVQYRETIKALQQQGMTIVISSHILSDLEDFCTAIGIMELGRLVESSQLQALYQRDRPHQSIIIATLGDVDPLETLLRQYDTVKACETLAHSSGSASLSPSSSPSSSSPSSSPSSSSPSSGPSPLDSSSHATGSLSRRLCIQFTGTTAESADLLRSLILSGHPITEFAPVQASLEDIFLELGYRQTS